MSSVNAPLLRFGECNEIGVTLLAKQKINGPLERILTIVKHISCDQLPAQVHIRRSGDVFEALSASDHQHKGWEYLTESMRAKKKFRIDGHIDPDLSDILQARKIVVQHEYQSLKAGRIDTVNARNIPRSAP